MAERYREVATGSHRGPSQRQCQGDALDQHASCSNTTRVPTRNTALCNLGGIVLSDAHQVDLTNLEYFRLRVPNCSVEHKAPFARNTDASVDANL